MEIAQGNDLGTWGDGTADVVGIDSKIVFFAAGKAADGRAEQASGVQQGVVGGLLDEHFIAGIEERGEREVIGQRGANGAHDRSDGDCGARGKKLKQRGIALGCGRTELKVIKLDWQLTAPHGADGGRTEIEAGRGREFGGVRVWGMDQRARGKVHGAL